MNGKTGKSAFPRGNIDKRGYSEANNKIVADYLAATKTPSFELPVSPTKCCCQNKEFAVPLASLADVPPDQYQKRIAELHLFGRNDYDLGEALSWPEFGVKGTRLCYGNCYGWFSHPNLDDILGDVRDCAVAAAAVATLTAIWASPSLALPVFRQAFYTCMETKAVSWATQIGVGLYTDTHCGRWHF